MFCKGKLLFGPLAIQLVWYILKQTIQLNVGERGGYLQLFRERLSYKRGKAYATMSQVIVGNGNFYGCLSEPQGVSTWWKETAQTRVRFFSFLVTESP